jgi:HAD superfamily hydrolase (TIGR01450 family)
VTLRGTDRPLAEAYDGTLLDLDGTVHRTGAVLSGVVGALAQSAADFGTVHVYVTNNASRTPAELVADLAAMGVATDETHVFTSAQAAARLAVDQVGVGAEVLVVGGSGVLEAVTSVGLRPVADGGRPDVVVQGWFPDLGWRLLAEGAFALEQGAFWVATNLDLTLPTSRGVAPGNGSFVHALSLASGRKPDLVAGKPEPAILTEAAAAAHLSRPLVVGDRLDTDIEGANAAGLDSLLVLTGVTDAYALLAADVAQRPTYVSAGLDGLLAAMPGTLVDQEGNASCGSARVARDANGQLDLLADGEPIDVLRAACGAAWQTPGTPVLTGRLAASIAVFERR